MRLKRLDLTRYGKFTDHAIDFGERKQGEPDLHIVYGPNEAGKSTALAAFLDLLFGIETRSRFGFLHPYPTMRIGGALELAAGDKEVIRIKRPLNSLLDGMNQPISDGLILGELGGVDRDSYRTMFSLDDETLEAGGESILASKGDLGQLLFSASAGLVDLSRSLVDLRAKAEGFYKYRARSGELQDLKARLIALKEERERIDTFASKYAQLVELRDRAASQYEEAIARRGHIQSRMDEIQRHLNALPRLVALHQIRERLAPLADLPDAPLGWTEELPRLQKEEIELATRVQGIEEEIRKLSADLDAIVVDEAALKLADRVARLADLRARHVTAEKDIPERRLQLREAELAIYGILSRMERKGEADPGRLVLGASVVGVLRDLIETRSGIEAAVRSTENELSEARRSLNEVQAGLLEFGGEPELKQGRDARISSLAATIAVLRSEDHGARRRLAERSRATHLEALADRMRALRPWQGEIAQLVELAVPENYDVERWKGSIAEVQKEIDRQDGELERLTTERTRLKAMLDAIGSVAGVVSDQEASSVRAAREQAWSNHRRTLDAASADDFEAALRHDDIVTTARFGHTTDLAKFNQASQELAIIEADLARAQDLRSVSMADLQRLRDEIAGALCAMTPAMPGDMSLPQLEVWLTRRDKALEVRASVLGAERDLREAEADAKAAQEKLKTALVAAGIVHAAGASFETLLAAAQAAVDREVELKALRDAIFDRQRDLKNRERDGEKAATVDQTWTVSWAKACSACWLGEGSSVPPLATVREILRAVADLGPALEKKAGLADRIGKMEKDQAAFGAEVTAIAHELNLNSTLEPPLGLAQAIDNRVQKAKAAQSSRAEKAESLDSARTRQSALAETLVVHTKRKGEMTTFFGANSLAEVAVKLQGIEKKAGLQDQANAITREILDAVRLPTMDEAERALETADRAAFETEVAELKARLMTKTNAVAISSRPTARPSTGLRR